MAVVLKLQLSVKPKMEKNRMHLLEESKPLANIKALKGEQCSRVMSIKQEALQPLESPFGRSRTEVTKVKRDLNVLSVYCSQESVIFGFSLDPLIFAEPSSVLLIPSKCKIISNRKHFGVCCSTISDSLNNIWLCSSIT